MVTCADVIVSPAPYLVAYRADGDLGYIDKDSSRSVHLIAVGPKLDKIAIDGLTTELLVFATCRLTHQQENGTLAYQSVRKEISKEKKALAILAAGLAMNLPTGQAGSFALVILNGNGDELNRISFDVVGHANVARSLEREAELKIEAQQARVRAGRRS